MTKSLPADVERLHAMGFAVHWLRPKSKIPVEAGWTHGERSSLERLKRKYRPNYNLGVRLGGASRVNGAYLAVLDLDIKSNDPRHKDEAYTALKRLYPQCSEGPWISSGRGNGSAHFYVLVKKTASGHETRARSEEVVKVTMPSIAPSRREKDTLTEAEIKSGVRLRPAWELSLLSEGRQAVLAGSIHPDTGKPYVWGRRLETVTDIPLVPDEPPATRVEPTKASLRLTTSEIFRLRDLDPASTGLRPEQVAALVEGEGVKDRSAEAFSLCMALVQRQCPRDDILSLLTRRDFYLGAIGFEHAKTEDRQRAARWVEKYCLRKAEERVNEPAFDIEETEEPSSNETVIKEPKAKSKRPDGIILPQGVADVGGWEDQLELHWVKGTPAPVVKPCYLNLQLILGHTCGRGDFLKRNAFRLNDFYTCDTPWGCTNGQQRSAGEDDALRIKNWLGQHYHMDAQKNVIDDVVNTVALQNQFHPVKDYLTSLKWDGKERVEKAFKTYMGAVMPEPYLSEVCRKFFIACVRRIFQPGCKFDHVVVLEGKQGIGKSSFPEILAGQEFFIDGLPNLQDKDAALNLRGAWLCELGELASIYRSHNETAKAFITRTVDRIRPPYGQRRMDYPRHTVFIGTTDKNDYLTDPAGNRRFWPVKVKQCRFEELERDRDQLWAEAMFLYQFFGEKLFLTGAAKEQAVGIQESRRVEDEGDAMSELFLGWVKEQAKHKKDISTLSLAELFATGPFVNFPRSVANTMRAGDVLRKAGYHKKHTMHGKLWCC